MLVILKTGPTKIDRKETVDSLFNGHLNNIGRLAKIGKLVVAGPMKKNDKTYRGIFILNVKTLDEANTLLATDPAIQEQLLEAELYEWYGSVALPLTCSFMSRWRRRRCDLLPVLPGLYFYLDRIFDLFPEIFTVKKRHFFIFCLPQIQWHKG